MTLFRQHAAPEKPPRGAIITWAAVMLVGLALILINFPKYQIGAYFDDSYYITLARSLLAGNHYGLINFPGEPQPGGFPIGLPLLLAPLVGLFPDNLSALKTLAMTATLVNASLLFWGWRLFSRTLSYWWGLAVSTLFLLAVVTIDLSGMVMSEPSFLTFTLLAILLAEQLIAGRPLPGWPLWMGVCLFFTVFIRTIGVTFFAALGIYLILAGGRKIVKPLLLALVSFTLLASLVVALTPVDLDDLLPIRYLRTLPVALVGAPSDQLILGQADSNTAEQKDSGIFRNYIVGGLQDLLRNKLRNAALPVTLSGRGQAWADARGLPFLPALLGYAVSAVILVGAIYWLRGEGLTAFFLAGVTYLAGLFVWVWNEPRFLYPILPQLLLAMLLGIYLIVNTGTILAGKLARRDFTKYSRYTFVLLVVGLAMLSALRSAAISPSRLHVGPLDERTLWLRDNAQAGEHAASEYPTIDYLYSGLQTVQYDYAATPVDLLTFIESKDLEYLLVTPMIKWTTPQYIPQLSEDMLQLLPLLEKLEGVGRLRLEFSNPKELIRIYRVLP